MLAAVQSLLLHGPPFLQFVVVVCLLYRVQYVPSSNTTLPPCRLVHHPLLCARGVQHARGRLMMLIAVINVRDSHHVPLTFEYAPAELTSSQMCTHALAWTHRPTSSMAEACWHRTCSPRCLWSRGGICRRSSPLPKPASTALCDPSSKPIIPICAKTIEFKGNVKPRMPVQERTMLNVRACRVLHCV